MSTNSAGPVVHIPARSGPCGLCKRISSMNCSGCKNIFYCNRKCQVKDWIAHKKNCNPTTKAHSEELGNHLITTRHFKQGELILKEKVAICAPTNKDGKSSAGFPLTCVTCFGPTENKCSKCDWPICSITCQEAIHHAENECPIVAEHKLPYERDDLQVLRMCLVKEKSESGWEKLLKLQWEGPIPIFLDEAALRVLNEEAELARQKFRITQLISQQEYLQMYRAARICGFIFNASKMETECENHRFGIFLYIRASMLAHSCIPNCYYDVSPSPDFELTVRAAVDLPKDTVITIMYNATIALCGTWRRQFTLFQTAGFLCKCPRCLDKTELGTFMSAWICMTCKHPILPIDVSNAYNGSWECTGCRAPLDGQFVQTQCEKLHTMVLDYQERNDFGMLHSMLVSYSSVALHPNHWILVHIVRAILRYLAKALYEGGTPAQEAQFMEFGNRMLALLEIISPGLSHVKSGLKMSLGVLTLRDLQKEMEKEPRPLTMEEFRFETNKILKWFQDSFNYFVNEETVPGGVSCGPNSEALICSMSYLEELKAKYLGEI